MAAIDAPLDNMNIRLTRWLLFVAGFCAVHLASWLFVMLRDMTSASRGTDVYGWGQAVLLFTGATLFGVLAAKIAPAQKMVQLLVCGVKL